MKNEILKLKKLFQGNNLNAIFLKQIFHSSITRILSIFISLMYVPLTLNYLDQEKYGIWITLTTIINWIAIFDVGMGNGLRNKLAEAIALNNNNLGRAYISTTYAFLGGIFFSFLLIFQICNPFINWQLVLNTTSISKDELYLITTSIISFVIIRFILQTITVIDASHGDSAKSGILQLISNIVSLILIWLATNYTEKGNLRILANILTVVPILVYIFYTIWMFNTKYTHLKPSFKLVQIKHSRDLISLSLQFFIVQITATILYSSVPFVITQFYGPNEVTQFNIASSIFNLPVMVITLICSPVVPLVTQARAKGDIIWLKNTLRRLVFASYFISIGTILLFLVSKYIYQLWIGDKVLVPLSLSFCIAIYTIINILVNPYSNFINGLGKVRILTIMAPLGIFMFLGFSYVLTQVFQNVFAISIALSLTSLVGLIIIPPVVLKNIK